MKVNKNYNAPKFEVIEFECEDVILTSELDVGEDGTGLKGDASILGANPQSTTNTVNTVNLFD